MAVDQVIQDMANMDYIGRNEDEDHRFILSQCAKALIGYEIPDADMLLVNVSDHIWLVRAAVDACVKALDKERHSLSPAVMAEMRSNPHETIHTLSTCLTAMAEELAESMDRMDMDMMEGDESITPDNFREVSRLVAHVVIQSELDPDNWHLETLYSYQVI